MKLFGFLNKIIGTQQLADKGTSKPMLLAKKRTAIKINTVKPYRVDLEMQQLRTAVETAESKTSSDRRPLLAVYKQVIKDSHLLSQLRTAHNTIQQSEFYIKNDKGAEQKDKLAFFQKGWFTDFITYVIDAEFYGNSLIELYGDGESGEFTGCDLIPRFHVNPQTGELIIDYDKDLKINYRDNLDKLQLIEIGKDELGILEVAAIEVIWKRYSRTDWSQRSEKFGMPLLSIETEATDDKELDEIENMAKNFGSNGYVIMNKGDKATMVNDAGQSGNGHLIFKDHVAECNDEISKAINGQTMTSDNGSSYSQSQVHERILNTYTLSRLQRIQREVNDKLIPFMVSVGYPVDGMSCQYKDLEKQEAKQTEPTTPTKTNNMSEKKNDISLFYDEPGVELANFKGIPESLFNRVMAAIHKLAIDDNLPSDDDLILEAKELVTATYKQLENGLQQGVTLSKYKVDKSLIETLKNGLWQFSGLKTQAQLIEATDLLFDENGDIKAWNKFRDDILSIHENYNVTYLKTEYDLTISSGQSAVNWKHHEDNKDLIYLQYRTAGDERVRVSHRLLDRITLPVDDPFWNYYYTPNGYGCRCKIQEVLKNRYKQTDSQTAMDLGDKSMIVSNSDGTVNERLTDKNKIFRFNPGKEGMIFPKGHPYYDYSNKNTDENINSMK